MKSMTVPVPDDLYRNARACAAERGTSMSALVTGYLRSLSERGSEFSTLEARPAFPAADRLDRDQAHDRAVR